MALDDYLRPYETKAKDAGILMTPVLIMNGKIKHNGSVPRLNKIVDWLLELK
jgi:protein-disulfide isomerase